MAYETYEINGEKYDIEMPSATSQVLNKAASATPMGVIANAANNIKDAANFAVSGPIGTGANPKDRLHLGAKALKGMTSGLGNTFANEMARTFVKSSVGAAKISDVAPIGVGAGVALTQPEQTAMGGLPAGSLAMGANMITDVANMGASALNKLPVPDGLEAVLPKIEPMKRPFRSIDDLLPKPKTAEGAVAGQVLDLGMSLAIPSIANAYTTSIVNTIAQREQDVIKADAAYKKFENGGGDGIAELNALHKNKIDALTKAKEAATGPIVRGVHQMDNTFMKETQPILLRARGEAKKVIKTQNKFFDDGMKELLSKGVKPLDPGTGETDAIAQALEGAIGNAREMREKGMKITEGQQQVLRTIDAIQGFEAGEKGKEVITPMTDIKSIWDSLHKKFNPESADWAIGGAKNALSKFLSSRSVEDANAVKFRGMYGALADKRDAMYKMLSPYDSGYETQKDLTRFLSLVQADSTVEGVGPAAHDVGNFLEATKADFPELYSHIQTATATRRQAALSGAHLAAQTDRAIEIAQAEHADNVARLKETNDETRERLLEAVRTAETVAKKAFAHDKLMKFVKRIVSPVATGILLGKGWQLSHGKSEGNKGGTAG